LPSFALQEFIQESARLWRRVTPAGAVIGIEQFLAKTIERGAIVDVVPGAQKMDREINFVRTLDGLFKNALGAPSDVLEELAMKFL
jgi:hypothetical protein